MSKASQRTIVMGIGAGVGLLWIATAVYCLVSAARGFSMDRTDWGVGWGLVGILLLGAGLAALLGTWWHQYRVLRDDH